MTQKGSEALKHWSATQHASEATVPQSTFMQRDADRDHTEVLNEKKTSKPLDDTSDEEQIVVIMGEYPHAPRVDARVGETVQTIQPIQSHSQQKFAIETVGHYDRCGQWHCVPCRSSNMLGSTQMW